VRDRGHSDDLNLILARFMDQKAPIQHGNNVAVASCAGKATADISGSCA
jgi:hypothetical protein